MSAFVKFLSDRENTGDQSKYHDRLNGLRVKLIITRNDYESKTHHVDDVESFNTHR